jgi:hypothetical protein
MTGALYKSIVPARPLKLAIPGQRTLTETPFCTKGKSRPARGRRPCGRPGARRGVPAWLTMTAIRVPSGRRMEPVEYRPRRSRCERSARYA